MTPSDQKSWGIIRYAPGSGTFCADDAAGFDGWYANKDDALAIAQDWAARHPQWVVGLVRSEMVWFGNGDFGTVQGRPLTAREASFKGGQHQ